MESPSRASQRGSAYILVLLVLVVLSLIGVAVVFVTQTEMEIGSNERGIQRIFYAAESGVALASARVLVSNDHRPMIFNLREPGSRLDLRHDIELAPVVPIYDAPCNLCEINNAGTYQEKAYRKINNAITVEATRTAGRDGKALGTRIVASMLELQPWKSPVEAYIAIGDESQLAKIRK